MANSNIEEINGGSVGHVEPAMQMETQGRQFLRNLSPTALSRLATTTDTLL